MYAQASRYLRQALGIAHQLHKLKELRECSYLLAMIYSLLGQTQTQRDLTAQIFLNADKEISKIE